MHTEALTHKGRELFGALARFSDFYLAGGAALALQIGHRISVDFALFSLNEISQHLLEQVKKVFSPRHIEISVNNPDELTVFIDDVKITFLRYPFPMLLQQVIYEDIRLLYCKEIGATKAYTIGRRGSFKDYVDIYYVCVEGHGLLEDIISLAENKYGGEFNGRLFLEQLVYMDDIDDEDILFLQKTVDRKTIELFFKEKIQKLVL